MRRHWHPDLELLDYLLRPTARHENDASAQRSLHWQAATEVLPQGLSLQWLGTAGFRFDYEGYTLLVDPFFTRLPLSQVAVRKPLEPDLGLAERYAPKVDAIVVGHTHFDHVLDVPNLAVQSTCRVYGSTSLRNLMGLYGRADMAVAVEPYRVYDLGPFRITFVPSRHAKLLLGYAVNSDGELTCDSLDQLGQGQYRCGQVWGIHLEVAGTTFYHQGSADLIDEATKHRDVDVFLCGIAGRGFSPRYVERVLGRLSPRVVIPHHYDNFFVPLDQPMRFSLNVNLGKFAEEVRAVSAEFELATLQPLQTMRGC